jgi:hypothetical protein
MPIRFVLDEHLRLGPLWHALTAHNAAGIDPVDIVQVGDPTDLAPGTPDPDLLLWAERHGRVLVSMDWNTLPGHLATHLGAGCRSPGIVFLRRGFSAKQVLDELVLLAHAGDPADLQDQIKYIP